MPFDGKNNEVIALVDGMLDLFKGPENFIKYEQKKGNAFCLYGALGMAAGGSLYDDAPYAINMMARPSVKAVSDAMSAEATARGYHGVPYNAVNFNNAKETTHADILDFLAKVKARLAQEA